MARLVALRRTKSEQDLPDVKTKKGVRLLVDLAEGDLPVLEFLNTYIQDVLDGSFHGNTEFYLRTHQFLARLEQFYRCSNSQCPYFLISFFRHVITLVSEALFTSASCDICKVAIETVVVTSPKVKVNLRDLVFSVSSLQDMTLKLEFAITRHLKENEDFNPVQLDSKSVITQTEEIWRLLKRCEGQMKMVTSAVEQKAAADRNFFQRASLGIGAVCAGRFLWSLWKGDSLEAAARAGLWSISTGMSGAVLQIPRARAQKILDNLEKQKKSKQELQEMVKHWLLESDGVCARLVLYSSMSVKQFL